MTITFEMLEAEVLNLTPDERVRLMDRMIVSLAQDPEWLESWTEEADRREATIAAGEADWVDGATALARIRNGLK